MKKKKKICNNIKKLLNYIFGIFFVYTYHFLSFEKKKSRYLRIDAHPNNVLL